LGVQVPSYPNDIAMAFIEEELGKPWYDIFEELSPEPIAAGQRNQQGEDWAASLSSLD
jgi:aarF domain-containing kinase